MTHSSPENTAPERGDALDRYLDNLLSPEERREFEQRLEREPDLALRLATQRRVDAALGEYARPPSPQRVLAAIVAAPLPGAEPIARIGSRTWPRRLAIAAVLILGVFGAWQVLQVLRSDTKGNYDVGPHRSLFQAYHDTVDAGFESDWTCRDDAEFALTFYHRFGQMLSMNPPLPQNAEALGLEYFDILTPKTIGMLTRIDDQPVMIFVDRLDHDQPAPQAPQGLQLFRRTLGELVLYEVSPLTEPGLIDHLRQPEQLPSGESPPPPQP